MEESQDAGSIPAASTLKPFYDHRKAAFFMRLRQYPPAARGLRKTLFVRLDV